MEILSILRTFYLEKHLVGDRGKLARYSRMQAELHIEITQTILWEKWSVSLVKRWL